MYVRRCDRHAGCVFVQLGRGRALERRGRQAWPWCPPVRLRERAQQHHRAATVIYSWGPAEAKAFLPFSECRAQVEPWLDTSTPDLDTIPTLSRHYPDTPTLRHQCQSTLGPTLRHQCQALVRPVSSHLDVGPPRTASSSVNGVKAKPTLRHSTPPTPPTPRHSTPPTLRHYRPRC